MKEKQEISMLQASELKQRLSATEQDTKDKSHALQQSMAQMGELGAEIERLRQAQANLALQAEAAEADRAHFEKLHDSAVRIAQSNLMQDRQSAVDALNTEFGLIMNQSATSVSELQAASISMTDSQQHNNELDDSVSNKGNKKIRVYHDTSQLSQNRIGIHATSMQPPRSRGRHYTVNGRTRPVGRSGVGMTPGKMTVDQLQLPTPARENLWDGKSMHFRNGTNFKWHNPDASFLRGSAQTPLVPNKQ
jgi:hypothetical protein